MNPIEKDVLCSFLIALRETSHSFLLKNKSYTPKTGIGDWEAQLFRGKTIDKTRAKALLTAKTLGDTVAIRSKLLEELGELGIIHLFRVDGEKEVRYFLTGAGEWLCRQLENPSVEYFETLGTILTPSDIIRCAREALAEAHLAYYDTWDRDVVQPRLASTTGRLDTKVAHFGLFLLVLGACSDRTAFQLKREHYSQPYLLQYELRGYLNEFGVALYGKDWEHYLDGDIETSVNNRRKQLNNNCKQLFCATAPRTPQEWKKLDTPYEAKYYWNVGETPSKELLKAILQGILPRYIEKPLNRDGKVLSKSHVSEILLDMIWRAKHRSLLKRIDWVAFQPFLPDEAYFDILRDIVIDMLGQQTFTAV